MKKYRLYKDSGLDWLGDIPSHWSLMKNRFGFRKHKNGSNESDSTSVLSLTIRGVKVKKDLNFGKSSESYIGHQLVEKGDIVFTPRDFDQTPILSDVSKFEGCISNLYIVDKTKDNVLNYFVNYYWYGLKYSVDYFKNFSHGMRYSFNRFQFDEIPLIIPSYKEQIKIVEFLDDKTKKIDVLTYQKKEKIELLKEKRSSLIDEVITRGIDGSSKMKDSKIEWIGNIPENWRIVPLRYLGFFQNGISKGSEFFGKGSPFMNYGDVYKNEITPIKVKGKVESNEIEKDRYSVKRGDVFFTRTSESKDDIGITSTCLQTIEGCTFSGFVIRFRFYSETHLPEYSKYHFQTHWKKVLIESRMNIVTRSSLSQKVLGQVPVLLPQLEEQQQIVEYLDKQTEEIDTLIQLEQKKIDTLKEYRQSLISEVVTGKVRVCEEDNSLSLNSQIV